MKKLLLLLLFPLTLLSCANNRIYGMYSFQMGSDKSTHFGVIVNLLNEDVSIPDEETGELTVKGKKFEFGMKFSEDIIPDPDDPDASLEQIFLYYFITLFNVEADPDAGLRGYFNVGEKFVEEKGRRLLMTPVIDPEEGEQPIDLPIEILEYFIVAYINKNKVDMVLPVSIDDIRYQLCWYGLYINLKEIGSGDLDKIIVDLINEYPDIKMPGLEGEERFGTHPTAAQVVEMNETYEFLFKDPGNPESDFTFRDFNTLTIELLKN